MLLPGQIHFALDPWHFGNFCPKIRNGGLFWGLGRGPQSPEANEVRGQSPQLLEAWGLGAEPPALKIFAFFCKMNLILELF